MGQDSTAHKVRGWAAVWAAEGRRAVLWLPVLMGGGIWLYFALAAEPDPGWCALTALPVGLLLSGYGRRMGLIVLAPALALAAFGAGFSLAVLSAHRAAAPVLAGPVQETVEGRVRELTLAASGAPRVLLDRVVIYGLDPAGTPGRVRVTLLSADRGQAPRPGERIRVFARLSPPGDPVEPGAYDFRLRAWFEGLGAVGYARAAAQRLEAAEPSGLGDGFAIWLAEQRAALSDALVAALPGRQGAFAAAIIVGDRSHIAEADNEALRVSSLAHLLAISGLHMGLLSGLVFAAVRLALAAWPGRLSGAGAKKLAAVAAVGAGVCYLALSGATVATQRAFVMLAVAFTAMLLDRPAITLRGLAVAAAVVLAVRPLSLMDAGFQMSFAATTALVAGYEELRRRRLAARAGGDTPRRQGSRIVRAVGFYVGALVFTSLVAGLATAPYAAFHFNRVAPYGLPANLAAVPAMGLVIAPAAILAGVLAPFGLEAPALAVMGAGIEWVLEVSHRVAALPGASRWVPAAPGAALGLITLGGLWLMLWRGPWRLAGLAGIAAALALWAAPAGRPEVLVAPGGRLVGVLGPEGRALDHPRAQSFAAETWLRRDGDGASQKEAAARPGLKRGKGWASAVLANGWRLEVVHERRLPPARLAGLCQARTLLIARYGGPHQGPCLYLGAAELGRLGAVAAFVEGEGLRLVPARDPERRRRWSGAASIGADQADHAALNLHLVSAVEPGAIGRVGGLQRDGAALAAQALERRLVVVDQRHDDVAVVRRLLPADHHDVAVVDAGLDHAVALDLEGIVLAGRGQHHRGHADRGGAVLQRLDRGAGGDAADQRYVARLGGAGHGLHAEPGAGLLERVRLGQRPLDHRRAEAAPAWVHVLDIVGQAQDLDGAGAVGQAADEAALLERGDQAVNAGFGAQAQGLLHLVEGGRDAIALHPLVDEHQEFVLLPGQHRECPRPVDPPDIVLRSIKVRFLCQEPQ
jgi:competence protein ComEC